MAVQVYQAGRHHAAGCIDYLRGAVGGDAGLDRRDTSPEIATSRRIEARRRVGDHARPFRRRSNRMDDFLLFILLPAIIARGRKQGETGLPETQTGL